MQWASALSTANDLDRAFTQAATSLEAQLGGTPPDVVIAFGAGSHGADLAVLPEAIRATWSGTRVFGCSAGGVLAEGREVEGSHALSLTAAVLPGVELRTFHLGNEPLPAPERAAWRERLGVEEDPHFVLLPDPFSFDPTDALANLDRAFEDRTKIGGLASGGQQPGQITLFADDAVHRTGAIGLSLGGNIRVDSIVCQGCRPVGAPMFVTRAQGNVIAELDGQTPATIIRSLWESVPPSERDKLTSSLFIGLAMTPQKESYRQGDFLVRNVIGFDERSGALAIASEAIPQSVVQFHLRDAETSAADIETLLGRYAVDRTHAPAGSLLFSCLGRGEGLYGTADHDSRAFARIVGPVPLGGFFCNGELGPVHGRTHLHGYTSVFGLFSPETSH